MTTFKAYFIQCITNLHAGSGDASYGVIDKLVQRDPVTDYPTIHASSLKGGLREHFEKKQGWKGKSDPRLSNVFGKEGSGGGESESGRYKFLNADLVALPVRCTHRQFVLSFDERLATAVNAKAALLTGKEIFDVTALFKANRIYAGDAPATVYAEDYALTKGSFVKPLKVQAAGFSAFDAQYATLENADFAELVRKLPVIARNNLENGISKNLWYEEIVPHQTVFITYIGTAEPQKDFEEALTKDVIQLGANATVGYGLCKFYPIN